MPARRRECGTLTADDRPTRAGARYTWYTNDSRHDDLFEQRFAEGERSYARSNYTNGAGVHFQHVVLAQPHANCTLDVPGRRACDRAAAPTARALAAALGPRGGQLVVVPPPDKTRAETDANRAWRSIPYAEAETRAALRNPGASLLFLDMHSFPPDTRNRTLSDISLDPAGTLRVRTRPARRAEAWASCALLIGIDAWNNHSITAAFSLRAFMHRLAPRDLRAELWSVGPIMNEDIRYAREAARRGQRAYTLLLEVNEGLSAANITMLGGLLARWVAMHAVSVAPGGGGGGGASSAFVLPA